MSFNHETDPLRPKLPTSLTCVCIQVTSLDIHQLRTINDDVTYCQNRPEQYAFLDAPHRTETKYHSQKLGSYL